MTTEVFRWRPGKWYGVPDEDYHSYAAASNSTLGKLLRSPAHMLWSQNNPSSGSSDAFRLGSAAHVAILEDNFEEIWGRGPDGDRRTKAVRMAWQEAEEKYGGNILRGAQYDACLAMRDAVAEHETSSALLNAPGQSEVSIVWDDEKTGVRCKGRIDRLPDDPSLGIVDLKTTKDASPKAFAKSLWAYGYFRQAAHYLEGLRVLHDRRHAFRFITVESSPPHGVAVYRIDDGSIDAGAAQLDRLLNTYRVCQDNDHYPAYPDEELDISVPAWAFAEIDKEL